jgi:hypothetical protein
VPPTAVGRSEGIFFYAAAQRPCAYRGDPDGLVGGAAGTGRVGADDAGIWSFVKRGNISSRIAT